MTPEPADEWAPTLTIAGSALLTALAFGVAVWWWLR